MRERPAPGEVHAWWARLDVGPSDLAPMCAVLLDAERRRAARFYFADARRRHAVARAIVRRLLAAYLGCEPIDVPIVTAPSGAPALAGGSGLRFGLARAGDTALVAVASDRRVGVDLESVAGATVARLSAWVRREALLKARGEGLTHVYAGAVADDAAPPGWTVRELDVVPHHVAALAIEGPLDAVRVARWA